MSTLIDKAIEAGYANGNVTLVMESGRRIQFPVAGNSRLENGTPEQLNNIKLSPLGIHWPELDEDLSLRGILAGDYGQR